MTDVFEEEGLWYFWDSTNSYKIGPYETKQACNEAFKKYVESL